MRLSDDSPLAFSASLQVELPPLTSWEEVEEFVSRVPQVGELTREQVKQSLDFLVRFRNAITHLPSPMPRRVRDFVLGLVSAAGSAAARHESQILERAHRSPGTETS